MILPYPIHLTQTVRVRLAALAAGYLLLGAVGLHQYLNRITVEILLGMLAILLTWDGRNGSRSASVCAIAGLLFALLYSYTCGKSLLFASIALCLLSLVQSFAGKSGWKPVCCLLLMSPLFDYFSNVFSFPLRIGLTRLAGEVLTVMGTGFHAQGNTLINGSEEFSVDPACMGLHMLTSSMLSGMILVGLFQRNEKRHLRMPMVVLLMAALFLLNILSNLFRIILLVEFRIPPEATMHSAAGMMCFALCVLLPAAWLTRLFVNRFASPQAVWENSRPEISRPVLLRHLLLLVTVALVTGKGMDRFPNDRMELAPVDVPGYTKELLHDRIVKLTSSQSLIYIKPIAGFYSPDHQPGICWTGSGYAFHEVQEKTLSGKSRYTARLEKDQGTLYSAWWYDSGLSTSTSQLEWRWDAFRYGRRYALVNITAATPAILESEIRKFTNDNPCHRMLLN